MTTPTDSTNPTNPSDPATPTAGPGFASVEELVRARLLAALGGVRGAVESALPTVGFAVAWMLTSDVLTSLIAAAALCGIALVVRLLQRQDVRFVAYAIGGVAVSAFFALRSGRAEDAFVPGMLWNAAYGAIVLASNLLGWPLLGFLIGAGDPSASAEDPLAWRRHRGVVALATKLTWVLVAMYAVRMAVMWPLYLAGNIGALAVAKVVLGWPLYLATVLAMGALLLRGHTPIDPELAAAEFARQREQPDRPSTA